MQEDTPPCAAAAPSLHLLSHLSYDGLLLKLSKLQHSAALLRRTIARRLAAVHSEEPDGGQQASRCAVSSVDSAARTRVHRLRSHDAYQPFHAGLLQREPEQVQQQTRGTCSLSQPPLPIPPSSPSALRAVLCQLRRWLRVGLQVHGDEERGAAQPPGVLPLPLHLHRACLRQLLDHCTALAAARPPHDLPHPPLTCPPPLPLPLDAPALSSSSRSPCSRPVPSVRLVCYGEAEVWLRCPLAGEVAVLRLPNLRLVCHASLHSQCLQPVERAARTRFPHLPERLCWRWHRAQMSISSGPDMADAVELQPSMDVLRCGLHHHDCALVAEIITDPIAPAPAAIASSLLTLIVQRLGGDHLILSVDGRDSIAQLKRHLHSSYDVPFDSQQLFIRQQMADDDRSLSSYLQPPDPTLTLLLASPAPLLITAAPHRPIHFYTPQAIEAVRACMQTVTVSRRQVQSWGVTECAEWLESCGDTVGRVWAEVQSLGLKGASATGLRWLREDDEEREEMDRWTQEGVDRPTRRSRPLTRDEVDVEALQPPDDAYPPATDTADPTLPVVELIHLDEAAGDWARLRSSRRKRARPMRAVSAPMVVSPRKRRARGGRGMGRAGGGAEVVDLVREEAGEDETSWKSPAAGVRVAVSRRARAGQGDEDAVVVVEDWL